MQNELYIVADAIKALREARGLTQEQLAEKIGVSIETISSIERGIKMQIFPYPIWPK